MTWRRLVLVTGLIGAALVWTMARVGKDAPAPFPTRSVLFCHDGVLWVLAPDGQTRTRLLGGSPLANALFPPGLFVSASGKIAFLVCPDEARAYVIEGTGRIRPLGIRPGTGGPRQWVAWSPDDVWVAVGGEPADSALWALNTRTGELRDPELPGPEDPRKGFQGRVSDYLLGWASDDQILMARDIQPFRSAEAGSGAPLPGRVCVYVVPLASAAGRRARTLAEFEGSYHAAAPPLPAGAAAVWVSDQVWLVSVTTGEHQKLASGLADGGERTYELAGSIEGDFIARSRDLIADTYAGWRIPADATGAAALSGSALDATPMAPMRAALWSQLLGEVGGDYQYPLRSRLACSAMPPAYWLAPAPDEAVTLVTVASEPPGAGVYVNGHYKGVTPCRITPGSAQPWAQRYWFAIVHDDREIVSRELFLRQGQHEDVSVVLDRPFTPTDRPPELAAARSAVRKAILDRDVEGLLRYVPERGLVLDDEIQPERLPRFLLREKLRRSRSEYAWEFLECHRGGLLEGGRLELSRTGWHLAEDAYSYCWVDFGQVGSRWYVTEFGMGNVNE